MAIKELNRLHNELGFRAVHRYGLPQRPVYSVREVSGEPRYVNLNLAR